MSIISGVDGALLTVGRSAIHGTGSGVDGMGGIPMTVLAESRQDVGVCRGERCIRFVGAKGTTVEPRTVELLLEGLIPRGASCAAVTVDDRSIVRREAERAAGRDAVDNALAASGLQAVGALDSDADGVPLWPPPLVGSISHSGDVAAALVGDRSEFRGLGIDIETTSALGERLWDAVASPSELRTAGQYLGLDDARAAAVVFCAKEALYKAHFPARRVRFDFRDVDLVLDDGRGWTCVGDVLGDDHLRVDAQWSPAAGMVAAVSWW